MGKPAARLGDMTAHGGSIVAGAPTVLIGGQPAARVGDMHACPMQTPAFPSPIPHVGMVIMPPGVPTVLICGQPAACVGDMVTCTGPPDTIAPPGCPTVLIGAGGGGGGGGGSGSGGSASLEEAEGSEAAESEKSHFLDVKFTDKGGFPIAGLAYRIKGPDKKTDEGLLSGNIKKNGVAEGDHEIELTGILDAQWSTKEAKVGDKVKIIAKTTGIKSGEPATIEVFIKDANFADRMYESFEAKVQSDKIEVEWELKVDEKLEEHADYKSELGRYSVPYFFFIVQASGLRQKSGLLKYVDWMELELTDEEGEKIGGAGYTLFLPNGATRSGNLDSNGYAKEENIPPGKVDVTYDTRTADE